MIKCKAVKAVYVSVIVVAKTRQKCLDLRALHELDVYVKRPQDGMARNLAKNKVFVVHGTHSLIQNPPEGAALLDISDSIVHVPT
jgi:hypothetical protein